MSGYGIPYTVRGWGDEIVTTVAICDCADQPPEGHTAVTRAGEGPVILVPTSALTPVDTTPPEPEPGAWLIGEALCWRDLTQDWRTNDSSIPGDWYEWPRLWALVGGSGITPRRLVPATAPVELPFEVTDISDCTAQVRIGVNSGMRVVIDHTTDAAGDYTAHAYLPDVAEAKGWALISAARAAREATP